MSRKASMGRDCSFPNKKYMENETRKMLEREILRLESEKELLLRKLQIAEDMNFRQYQELMHLSYKVRMMEGR